MRMAIWESPIRSHVDAGTAHIKNRKEKAAADTLSAAQGKGAPASLNGSGRAAGYSEKAGQQGCHAGISSDVLQNHNGSGAEGSQNLILSEKNLPSPHGCRDADPLEGTADGNH